MEDSKFSSGSLGQTCFTTDDEDIVGCDGLHDLLLHGEDGELQSGKMEKGEGNDKQQGFNK